MTLPAVIRALEDAVELLRAADRAPSLRAALLAEAKRLIEDARRGL